MSRSRNINETEATTLRAHIFKATLESALKGLGAQQVTFEGLDRAARTAVESMRFGQRIIISARWLEDGQLRQCNYSTDWGQFDAYMLGSDLAGAKHWARSIAKEMALERIQDVLQRATMTIPLNQF